ncbi:transketolase [Paraglaciecola sp.]|uniref:transketolase n=1 Tax=Paraglaciecola sp. TaxID=1920173 RepID=UPI003EF5D05E
MHQNELEKLAANVRYELVRLSQQNGVPHLACALSCVDILAVLYGSVMKVDGSQPELQERDLFYLGKGHACAALYAMLAHRGYFPLELLNTLGKDGSILEEHPGVNAPPGIEHVSGSLGHALSLATGRALASKIQRKPSKHFVLVGDGETNEGTIWEAALFAPAHKLDNLTVIVDFNKLQGTGRSCEIMSLEPMEDKWRSFGWETIRVDGHNIQQLEQSFNLERDSSKPLAIIADTVKGKGISFMHDDNNWHYRIPTLDEVKLAKLELNC